MASTYLYRDISSASNRRTWTWSAWIKRGSISGNQSLFTSRSDNSNYDTIRLEGGKLHIFSLVSSSFSYQVKTNRQLRDTHGWYHLVIAVDTTQATASNRVKLYVNGEQETSLAESSYPSQNYEGFIMRNRTHYIGQGGNLGDKFDGCMSHIHCIDGTQYAASDFGSTDSTTGEWQINTSPNVTYGTEGFFILKDGNSLTDQSTNSNNYTASGSLTNTEDNPSNTFATLNALDNYYASNTFSNGNLSITTDSTKYAPAYSTLGASSGKYYAECKMTAGSSARIGIISRPPEDTGATSSPGNDIYSVAYYSVHGTSYTDGSASTYGSSYTNGDIIGIAMDLDNNKLYFHKNGTYQNSGVPTSGSTGTGALTIPTPYNGNFFHFAVSDQHDSQDAGFTWNFGNGYFGTTAISSEGTNASGLGKFEYDVPTGYTALCTKGLNE